MKPRIYLHVYPSGLKFWRVRRAFKARSRHRPDERMAEAYAFVARLNRIRDEEFRLKLIANLEA